jgi:cytochrome c oxidase cbb3-type subunit 3
MSNARRQRSAHAHGASAPDRHRAPRRLALVLLAALTLAACEREARRFEPPVGKAITPPPIRMSAVQPAAIDTTTTLAPHYEVNAYSLAEGKRLFDWYNCNGCHANGGGDKGPALMDDTWIYGSEPSNIYATIVEGRPNGMPSFGGHIPDNEIWELVAYVRSMSGLVPKDAAPSRNDDIQAKKSENRLLPQPPQSSGVPPASERSQ